MHQILLSGHFHQMIRYVPTHGVTYLNNPKVACTTVKSILWQGHDARTGQVTFAGDPHDHRRSPFPALKTLDGTALAALATSRCFTLVRNPYVRALSAYRNKLHGKTKDRFVRAGLSARYDLAAGYNISFLDFLRLLTFDDPIGMDPHFAPQWRNLLTEFMTTEAVFALEAPEPLWDWLRAAGFSGFSTTHSRNQSGAADVLVEHYDAEAIGLVQQIYARDFQVFGYPTEFSRAMEPPSQPPGPVGGAHARPSLAELLAIFLPGDRGRRAAIMDALAPVHGDDDWFRLARLRGRFVADPAEATRLLAAVVDANRDSVRVLRECVAAAESNRLAAVRDEVLALSEAAATRHKPALPHLPYGYHGAGKRSTPSASPKRTAKVAAGLSAGPLATGRPNLEARQGAQKAARQAARRTERQMARRTAKVGAA